MLSEVERESIKEERLSGYQRKKGAILFGAVQRELRVGTPVAYKTIEAIEDKTINETVEIADENGQPERVSTQKIVKVEKTGWAFGIITGIAPSIDSRGLHGTGYEIANGDGSVITVPKDAIITKEMHDHIKYRPTLLTVYRDNEPVLVVFHTWDSFYLPCPFLRDTIGGKILDNSFMKYIDNQKGYIVDESGPSLTVKVVDANRKEHVFGPMSCSLFYNSDCRGCLVNLLDYSDSGWNEIRKVAKDLCGRGTMYIDSNFIIRKDVAREAYIRFMEIERWAKTRSLEYISALLDAILSYQERSDGLSSRQYDALVDIIKERVKEENAVLKKSCDSAALDEFKAQKKQIMADLKKVKLYDGSVESVEVDEGEEIATEE